MTINIYGEIVHFWLIASGVNFSNVIGQVWIEESHSSCEDWNDGEYFYEVVSGAFDTWDDAAEFARQRYPKLFRE